MYSVTVQTTDSHIAYVPNSGSGGVKYQTPKPITFRGWDIMTWQMNDDSYVDLSGTDKLTGKWMFDSFFIKHEDTGDDEELPQQAWTGSLRFDDLKYVKYDNNAVQTATLEDIGAVEGVNDITDIIINPKQWKHISYIKIRYCKCCYI